MHNLRWNISQLAVSDVLDYAEVTKLHALCCCWAETLYRFSAFILPFDIITGT